RTKGSFRTDNAVNQALYYLWIAGELMMHSRKGQERVYDLRERLVPAQFNVTATAEEAEAFFALQLLHHRGLLAAHEWRKFFEGTMVRSVEMEEASARLEALVGEGKIAAVLLEGAAKTLVVKGFWLEHHAVLTGQFMTALARAFQRFMRFVE